VKVAIGGRHVCLIARTRDWVTLLPALCGDVRLVQ